MDGFQVLENSKLKCKNRPPPVPVAFSSSVPCRYLPFPPFKSVIYNELMYYVINTHLQRTSFTNNTFCSLYFLKSSTSFVNSTILAEPSWALRSELSVIFVSTTCQRTCEKSDTYRHRTRCSPFVSKYHGWIFPKQWNSWVCFYQYF